MIEIIEIKNNKVEWIKAIKNIEYYIMPSIAVFLANKVLIICLILTCLLYTSDAADE